MPGERTAAKAKVRFADASTMSDNNESLSARERFSRFHAARSLLEDHLDSGEAVTPPPPPVILSSSMESIPLTAAEDEEVATEPSAAGDVGYTVDDEESGTIFHDADPISCEGNTNSARNVTVSGDVNPLPVFPPAEDLRVTEVEIPTEAMVQAVETMTKILIRMKSNADDVKQSLTELNTIANGNLSHGVEELVRACEERLTEAAANVHASGDAVCSVLDPNHTGILAPGDDLLTWEDEPRTTKALTSNHSGIASSSMAREDDLLTGEYEPRTTKTSDVDNVLFGDSRHIDRNLSSHRSADGQITNDLAQTFSKKKAAAQEAWGQLKKKFRNEGVDGKVEKKSGIIERRQRAEYHESESDTEKDDDSLEKAGGSWDRSKVRFRRFAVRVEDALIWCIAGPREEVPLHYRS